MDDITLSEVVTLTVTLYSVLLGLHYNMTNPTTDPAEIRPLF